jgi:ABC-type Fe3+/spermidine/putrescine transport system ATPase subunit
MNQGRIEQDASPERLFQRPATPFVANFLGFSNLIEGLCMADGQVETALGVWPVQSENYAAGERADNNRVMVLIRPEAASFQPFAGSIMIEGRLTGLLFRGRFYQAAVLANGQQLTFEIPPANLPSVGEQIKLWLDPAGILLLPFPNQGLDSNFCPPQLV